MSDLSNRLAKRLLHAHSRVFKRIAGSDSGWWTDLRRKAEDDDKSIMDSASSKFRIGGKVTLTCEVVDDERSQTVGLQKYASVPNGYGMAFIFEEPKTTTFHMGTVAFPIDIMFIGPDSRVSRIVKYAEPGSREKWGMPRVSMVLEANAGFCDEHGIEVGDSVKSMDKTAQETFPKYPRKDINPKRLKPSKNKPHDRFRDRGPVDEQVKNQPIDGKHRHEQVGRDPLIDSTDSATRP